MRSTIILILLFSFCDLSAQRLLSQEHYDNGHLRTSVYAENGNIHFVLYHENGRIAEMGSYRDGERNGMWRSYDRSGNLMAHGRFINDRRVGSWTFRAYGGQETGSLQYEHGILHSGKIWDTEGNVVASTH